MYVPSFDNNSVLAPGVDGFKNLVDDLTVNKVDTVKVKKALDKLPDNKTVFNLNQNNNIVDGNYVNPVKKLVTDFGLNINKGANDTVGKHAVETPVNLSEIIQPLLKPVMDLFKTGKPKTDSRHHKSSHKTSKSQWVYFDRYRILPKPFNDFLNGLKVPRFYYLTLRDWTIVQALQMPLALGVGGSLGASFGSLFSGSLASFLPPSSLASTVIDTGIIGVVLTVIISTIATFLSVILNGLLLAAATAFVIIWAMAAITGIGTVAGIIVGFFFAVVGIIPGGLGGLAIAALLSLFSIPIGWICYGIAMIFVILGLAAIIIFAVSTGIFIAFSLLLLFALIPLMLLLSVVTSLFIIFVVISISILFWTFLATNFIRSLGKPSLLTKRSLDKARRSSHHHSKSHHSDKSKSKQGESEHSKSGDSKSKKHHHKKKSNSPLDGVNNTLRDLLGTNPKTKHKKHHTSAVSTTSTPRHKVSTVKQVVVDYSQVTGVNNTGNVSNLVGLNQANTATNISNLNLNTVGMVRIPVVLLANVENLLSISNTVTPTLLKQQDTAGGDNTVCTPSGLVGITCTTVSPTVNENINSAVEEQTQVVPQTTTTTTTNTDGTTTKTTTVDKNKPPKVVPKKVWPLPTTGLMSRIDYFVLQNRATGRHNNLVNTMDALYGTKHHPGPLRPIAEATAGLVDNI